MKQNINNNSESKNVVKNMKQLLNDESNLFNEVDLKLFGVQAYGVTYGEEYNVITKAARRANGRYYFITREGYEIAWSTIPADKVAKICADMFDQIEQDKQAAAENYNRIKRNGVALIRSELMQSVYDLADAEGVHLFMLVSGVDECGNVLYKMALGSTSDEGEKIAKERNAAENAARIEAERKANHSAEFLAEFKEREAEKIARRIMEGETVSVKVENGETLYHVNGLTFGKETAERVNKYIKGRKSLAANALEMGGPSDYFSNEMNQAAAALDRIAAAERPAEEVEQVDECTTARRHTDAARIMQTAQVIAEAVGAFTGSTYPAHDIKTDCTRFAKWIEGEECETINPAAPFWFAVRKQGAESGTREYVKKRCAGLGAPVYVLKVERETLPGLFTLTVRVSSPATAAQIFEAATANSEPTEPATAAEGSNTNPEATEPATEPESEPQSEPKAPTLAEIAADYAAGTADSIRRRWHAFAAKATTAARAAGCYIGMALILAVTAAAFILSAWFVPDMVESWPDLPRIFGVVVGVFGFTMGVEYLTIKVCDAIDAKTGFFGFNPLAYRR